MRKPLVVISLSLSHVSRFDCSVCIKRVTSSIVLPKNAKDSMVITSEKLPDYRTYNNDKKKKKKVKFAGIVFHKSGGIKLQGIYCDTIV